VGVHSSSFESRFEFAYTNISVWHKLVFDKWPQLSSLPVLFSPLAVDYISMSPAMIT